MTKLLLRKFAQFSQLVVAINVLLLSGCASTGGYISGQVLDADTREPIPDAHVFITWKGGSFALVDTRTVCVYADGTLTDEDGKYRFLPWIGRIAIQLVQWDLEYMFTSRDIKKSG